MYALLNFYMEASSLDRNSYTTIMNGHFITVGNIALCLVAMLSAHKLFKVTKQFRLQSFSLKANCHHFNQFAVYYLFSVNGLSTSMIAKATWDIVYQSCLSFLLHILYD